MISGTGLTGLPLGCNGVARAAHTGCQHNHREQSNKEHSHSALHLTANDIG